jgi:hypothetical protein
MQVREVGGIPTVNLTDWDDLDILGNIIIQELGGK